LPETPPPTLSPGQVTCLERLLQAGFQFITFEQFARYPAVEKQGCVALLDVSSGRVRQFGSMGYHLGGGIGVLIERGSGKAFVWKNETREATPELLATFESVRRELTELLAGTGRQ